VLDSDNRLFVLARQGRRPPSALVAIAVTFVILVVTIIGGQMLGRLVVRALFPRTDFLTDILGFLPIYLCLWVWLRLWSKRSFQTLGLEWRHPMAWASRGALVGVIMMTAVALVIAILPGTRIAPGQLRTTGLTALGAGLLALVGTTVQASGEELLFRGWLFATLGARYRPWIAVTVSSLLFGLVHALNPNATLLGMANLTLFGAFLALFALAEGGLWSACAWHTIWNWSESSLFGLRGSGGPVHPALLMSVQPDGPNILTGGLFGPDGGVIQTTVLLMGVAFVAVRLKADAKKNTKKT
jgi:membrane protease YdiL (CAAX protease family)